MRIIFNKHAQVYIVKLESEETETYINTDDITVARTEFIKQMTILFNNTVCRQFTDDVKADFVDLSLTNKICQSESDHEWECCGASTGGTHYRCKKCGEYRIYPIERSEELTVTL